MCQLLGMSCNVPTDICFSFSGFSRRGGGTDVHKDGWGIGFFEGEDGRGCRVFLDPSPSIDSPLASLVKDYPIQSMNVVAHIRKATQGDICLQNTHPFQRELWGRYLGLCPQREPDRLQPGALWPLPTRRQYGQ